MKNYFIAFLFFISIKANAQTNAEVYNLEQYQNCVLQNDDTLYVVNFWATWCKPCVEELPYFQQFAENTKNLPVKVILVSQDAKSRTMQVAAFMEKNKYTSKNFILSAGNPNVWINAIEPKWSGTIPATVIYKNGQKLNFKEGEFASLQELNEFINPK